jgi:DNA-binding response OmpR family regulator
MRAHWHPFNASTAHGAVESTMETGDGRRLAPGEAADRRARWARPTPGAPAAEPAEPVAEQVVSGHRMRRSDALRTLVADGQVVRFTPTEYRLLVALLDWGDIPVPYARLTDVALGRAADRETRRVLDKHIDHVRGKLSAIGLTLGSVPRYGIVLIPDERLRA